MGEPTGASSAASGASFTAAARSPSKSLLAPRPGGPARTIVETALCPSELKRGSRGWSIQDLKVQRVLGEGALSTVVHATCTISGLPLALKMYHREKLNHLNVKQVAREIEIHASMTHHNAIKLYAAFEDAEGIYLVQEFANGGDLYAELARHGGYMLEAHVVKNVIAPFLTAICHLHSRGILHRDIKPENILLSALGEVKVADFGLAIDTVREKPMSRVGTLDYMPPEIAMLPQTGLADPAPPLFRNAPNSPASPKPVDPSPLGSPTGRGPASLPPAGNYGLPADIWCTGILAYELLVGGPPFEAETKAATYTRILKTEPAIPNHISPLARDFIKLALQKDPKLRPTAEQLLDHPWIKGALPQCTQGATGTVARTRSVPGSPCLVEVNTTMGEPPVAPGSPVVGAYTAREEHKGSSAETAAAAFSPPSPKVAPQEQVMGHSVSANVAAVAEAAARKLQLVMGVAAGDYEDDPQEGLIAASYGDDPNPCAPQSLLQMLARPPPPSAGASGSKRRPRILSAYLKKLSGFLGSRGEGEEQGEEVELDEEVAPPKPASRMSRLGPGRS